MTRATGRAALAAAVLFAAPAGLTGPARAADGTSDREPTAPAGIAVGFVHPTVDLDGDRFADLVTIEDGGAGNALTCRSGRDGRALASYALDAAALATAADEAWQHVVVATPAPGETPDLTVTWLSGCQVRWTRTYGDGVDPLAPGANSYLRGIVRGRSEQHVLVEVQTETALGTESVVHLLSPADGRVVFESAPARFVDEHAEAVPLPDISGDGRGEFGYAVLPLTQVNGVERPERLDAHRSTDGELLWSAAVPVFVTPDVGSPGDLTRDGVPDVLVSSHDPAGARVSLVDGASGEVRWTVTGERPVSLGGPGGLVAVSRVVFGNDRIELHVAAVTPTGSIGYRRTTAVGPVSGHDSHDARWSAVGDLDEDGVVDVAYSVVVRYDDDTERRVDLVLSGLAGAVRHRQARPLGVPADDGGASVDGSGDDVWVPGTPEVRDGATGRLLRRWVLGGGVQQLTAYAGDSDRCTDFVAVTASGTGDGRLVAVDGATGTARWAVPRVAPGTRALTPVDRRCVAATAAPRPRGETPRIPATGGPSAVAAVVVSALAVATARRHRGWTVRCDRSGERRVA